MINLTEFLNCTVGNASIEYSQCLEDVPPYENCPDPSLCGETSGGNVGLAFGLTIGAGLATTLGALLPFVPFIKQRSTWFLAASMALAAGVMLYVSFTEIRTKSLNSFCCVDTEHYDVMATACFFGGIILTATLDCLVWVLQRVDCGLGSGKLKRVKFSKSDGSVMVADEEGRRRRGVGKGKVSRLHATNGTSIDMDRLDVSALIYPHDKSGGRDGESTESSSQSTTPTAGTLERGCEPAVEEEGAVDEEERKMDGVMAAHEGETKKLTEDTNSVQHSQTMTGECV